MTRTAVLVATRPGAGSEAARRRVAGVPLVKRAILVCARAGFDRVVVIGDDDTAMLVGNDAELAALAIGRMHARAWDAARADATGEVVVLGADAVFDVNFAKAARAIDSARIVDASLLETFEVKSVPEGVEALWHDAKTPEQLARAEDALFKSLGKRTDGPISRAINRHVSTFVTRRLVNTNVTPNQMTVVANVIGALGVICVFQQTWALIALGAFLVQMQSILDGCDGEIARLKFKSSKVGEWLDNVLDDQVNIGYGVGLGFAGAVITGDAWWRWVGIGAGSAYMIHNAIFYWQLAVVHRSGNPFNFRWWFEKPGIDVTAMLAKNTGLVSQVGSFFRALIRRDVFLFGFMLLVFAKLPHVAALWYAIVAASQFALMMVHVANGGAPAASRAKR